MGEAEMDKKLTDSEIVKALECCRTNLIDDCKRCNLRLEDGAVRPFCTTILLGNSLDLINRLQAENERLKEEIELLHSDYTYKFVKARAKAEAVKEFAERLDDVFAEIENKIPKNKIVLKTIQVYKKIIQIVKEKLVGDING